MDHLLSSNYSLFLDESERVPKIAFASLMRSGNTFCRKLTESITGVATGSNFMNTSSLQMSFVIQGFKGETITDDKTWIVKTHFPYTYPITTEFTLSRSLVLVRNPFDVITSLF